jgi:hypothetical protein
LEENDLKEYVEDVFPSPNDLVDLIFQKKRDVKAKWLFLESVKDHLIPQIVEKSTAKDMHDDLVGLYQNMNTDRMGHLKHQLNIVRMTI